MSTETNINLAAKYALRYSKFLLQLNPHQLTKHRTRLPAYQVQVLHFSTPTA